MWVRVVVHKSMVVDIKRGIMLRYNSGHVNESLNHQCRWHWLLKGVQPTSCIPNQYPWSILVGFWGKTGLPICAILLFPWFVIAIFVSIERTIFLGLNLMKTLKFCYSYTSSELYSHAWTQTSCVIWGITVSEMSARGWQMWQGPAGVLLAQQLEVQQDYLGMTGGRSCFCLSSWIKAGHPRSQGRPKQQHQKCL